MSIVSMKPFSGVSDVEGFWDVRALTYNNGNPVPEERRVSSGRLLYAAETEGKVIGCMSVFEMPTVVGARTLQCGGVAGVAVAPHRRRGGVGSEMLAWLPGELRAQGYALSSLYAFREPFYRRAGYEVCGKRLKVTCPTDRFPRVERPLAIHRLGPADFSSLGPAYEGFARTRAGMVLRSEEGWMRVLAENRELTVYAAGDPVEAYVVVSHNVAFWSTDHISEIIWSTKRGYDSVIDFLRQLAINKTALSWFEPSDSPFYASSMDQGIQIAVERPIMFRVVNVKTCLEGLEPVGTGDVSFSVRDAQVPENDRIWRVSWSEGNLDVREGGLPEFDLTIQQFTQVFLGEPSLADLLRHGGVDGSAAALLPLFPARPVICADFF